MYPSVTEIIDAIQQLRRENIEKMSHLQNVASQSMIALNTRANEYRLGADSAYESVLTKINELLTESKEYKWCKKPTINQKEFCSTNCQLDYHGDNISDFEDRGEENEDKD